MAWTAALSLVARTGGFSGALQGAGNVARAFGNQLTTSMSKSMMATNIAQKAMSGLTEAFFQATAQAKNFTNIASRLNLRPEEVAQLSEAAEDAGIPLMALSKGMRDIQKFGAQGLGGGLKGELAEAADLLGLSNEEFKVMAAGGKDAMQLVASKMRGMDDEAKKFLITQKLHGRNAQFLGQIYDKSGEEIEEMFKGQIASSDETIAANKKIYQSIDTIKDIWNTFLAWVVARTQWLVKIVEVLAIALKDIGELIGWLWDTVKEWLDGMGILLEGIVALLTGEWSDAAALFQKFTDKMAAMWEKLWDKIVEYGKARWKVLKDTLYNLTPNWMKRLFGMDTSGGGGAPNQPAAPAKIKQPEQTKEEKEAAQKIKDEIAAEKEKQRWQKASNEEKREILAEQRAAIAAEMEAAKKKYEEDQKAKMKEMGKTWDIDPNGYKETEKFLEAKKRMLELQEKELQNEKDIAEEERKRREEAEKAAKEELDRKREIARKGREWQDELFDAQIELLRRNLEDSEATAVEKAQAELAIENEKMTRLQREMAIAQKEGDQDRVDELAKSMLAQSLNLDAASRSVAKAQKEEAAGVIEDTGGRVGKGDNLTSTGLGGSISFAPIDIAKSQLQVQKQMNANLEAIRRASTGRSENNAYVSNLSPDGKVI